MREERKNLTSRFHTSECKSCETWCPVALKRCQPSFPWQHVWEALRGGVVPAEEKRVDIG